MNPNSHDVLTLCLRLCLEPADSHSPETQDVLERYRPAWEAAAGGMPFDQALALVASSEIERTDPDSPTHFEMARTRTMRSRIKLIVETHDRFVSDPSESNAVALKHCIDGARGIGLTKDETMSDLSCPYAEPHYYCDGCKVSPCPIGLPSQSERKSE